MEASLNQLEMMTIERGMITEEARFLRNKPLPWSEADRRRIIFITCRLNEMDKIVTDLHRMMERFCQ